MRTFTLFVFGPACVALIALTIYDRLAGQRLLWRAVWLGIWAGLIAAVAYDIFRLPFVYASEIGIDAFVPPLKLFKVFPRFGAMLLGQPIEQQNYSLTAQAVGWIYHFSNGATFGVMYVALLGDPSRRHWAWGIVMAVGLELGMLLTPYPGFFNIPLTTAFVFVTFAAHTIFGVALGKICRGFSQPIAVS